jgi:hypothetical protein
MEMGFRVRDIYTLLPLHYLKKGAVCVKAWQINQNSIVGVSSRIARQGDTGRHYDFTGCGTNLVLTNMAFVATSLLPQYAKADGPALKLREHVAEVFNCDDLAMNFVSSATLGGPPVILWSGAGGVTNIHHKYVNKSTQAMPKGLNLSSCRHPRQARAQFQAQPLYCKRGLHRQVRRDLWLLAPTTSHLLGRGLPVTRGTRHRLVSTDRFSRLSLPRRKLEGNIYSSSLGRSAVARVSSWCVSSANFCCSSSARTGDCN